MIRVLVATNHLNRLGGTETYTYALINELVKRDNVEVEYFTLRKGEVSNRIESDLRVSFLSKKRYDLILANHNTVVNKLYLKGFTVQTCHGVYPKLEQPSKNADVYISISKEVQKHLKGLGFDSRVIFNGINTDRFKPNKEVNSKLKNVLSLCQSESANEILKICCIELGVNFKRLNKFENPIWNVEDLINGSDMVVGLGRSAYEAMACGRPVVVFDDRPYLEAMGDGYIKNIINESLDFNCSGRYTKTKFNKESLKREFLKYNPEDSFFFREFALDKFNIVNVVDNYLSLHSEISYLLSLKKKIKQALLKLFQGKMYIIKRIRKK